MGIMDQLYSACTNQNRNQSQTSFMGVYLARVIDIKDEENLGRVLCKFYNTEGETDIKLGWAYVMTPFAGNECGIFFMPNLDDLVLVAFGNGDIHRPYVIGSIWNSSDANYPRKPPVQISEGKNETYLIKTPNKSIIQLADKQGEENITINTPKGRKLELNDKTQQIALSDGDNSITLDSSSGEVTIKCKNKLTIEVGTGNTISIDGTSGTVKLQGQQSISIEGVQVKINANAETSIKGSAQVSIQSDGITTVKGSMLQLN